MSEEERRREVRDRKKEGHKKNERERKIDG